MMLAVLTLQCVQWRLPTVVTRFGSGGRGREAPADHNQAAITRSISADEFRIGFRYLFVLLDDLFPTPTVGSDHYIKGFKPADTLRSFC
jgi:hypothetical protein